MTAGGHRAILPSLSVGGVFLIAGVVLVIANLERGVGELVLALLLSLVAGAALGWWLLGARRLRAALAETIPPPEPVSVVLEPAALTVARGVSISVLLLGVLGIAAAVIGALDGNLGVLAAAFGVAQLVYAAVIGAWERRHDHRLAAVGDVLKPVPR